MCRRSPEKLLNYIRYYRLERGYTQAELARYTGLSENSILAFETGLFCPSARAAALLCEVLRVKFEELFYLQIT